VSKNVVVILCGGKGSRLGSADGDMPKPMVRIGRYPLVAHIIQNFESQGYSEFILACGYKIDTFVSYFANWKFHKSDFFTNQQLPAVQVESSVSIAWTGNETETGGRLFSLSEKLMEYDRVLVTYGDTLTNCDIKALEREHIKSQKEITMTIGFPRSRFGEVELSEENEVLNFKEKPVSKNPVSIGIFCMNTSFISRLNEESILEDAPILNSLSENQLHTFLHNGFWMPLDTQREYEKFVNLIAKNEKPWEFRNA
jgi:glucose-1-phosphate cytidylyltransferase